MTIRHAILASQDPRLKRHIRHDPRSLAYPFIPLARDTISSIQHERYVPVFDQGQIGDCTANAALGALGSGQLYVALTETQPGRGAPIELPKWDQSAPDGCTGVYHDETVLDSFAGTYPPDDTGSDGLSAAKVLKARGWISGYTHVLNGSHGLAEALQDGPVIVGITWWSSFYTPNSSGVVEIADDATVAGGHELVVDQFDATDGGYFGLTNSWGTSWGINGRFHMSVDTMDQLLSSAEGGDATVFAPVGQPAPVPITDPALARLLAKESSWLHSRFPAYGAKGAQTEINRYLASVPS
jgi:hypothetical protein